MADLFSNYEQDFREVYASLESRLRNIPQLATDQKFNEIKKAENDIRDADDILQSMNLNARNVPSAAGQKLQGKIREYDTKIATAKKDLRHLQTQVTTAVERESLMGGAVLGEELQVSMDQRQRLLDGTDRLNRTNAVLAEAMVAAEDTARTGANILDNLGRQRETMQRGLGRLDDINDKLARSSKILSGMARRVVTNKLIMAVIVLVLLGAIALVVWLKWFNN